LASISQQVPTDFDIDIFVPIIKIIQTLTAKQYQQNAFFTKDAKQLLINRDFKIIADHIKACTFAIADGALPSNKERGSVLRRLIRRSMISARRLQINDKFSAKVADEVIEVMNQYYPYLSKQRTHIHNILNKEEALFSETLEHGFKLFENAIKQNQLSIDNIFKLVDTYGFPFEIIVELANERNIKIDEAAYQKKMFEHQNISRGNFETKGMILQNQTLVQFTENSTFDYDKLVDTAKIIGLFDLNFHPVTINNNEG
jgi:alanyl-tRNA synthetase